MRNAKNCWIALGGAALVLRWWLPPDVIEAYYSRGLFLFIRKVLWVLTGWLPIPAVYLLAGALIVWLVHRIRRRSLRNVRLRQRLWSALHSLLALAAAVVFLFLLLWGYNYQRIPLEDQAGLPLTPLEIEALRSEMEFATAEAILARQTLVGNDTQEVAANLLPGYMETTLRQELSTLLHRLNYPVPAPVRVRRLFPKGMLLRISTAGVYLPFSGEGHVDPGLHHLQLPFVMIHEMGHAYGFGAEGTCNFLAYLTCRQSADQYLNYTGALYYWRYVASNYRQADPEGFYCLCEELPAGIRNDLAGIRRAIDRYPDIFPAVRDAAYATYLRAQGIRDGLKNYDRVIMMVHAWRKSEKE